MALQILSSQVQENLEPKARRGLTRTRGLDVHCVLYVFPVEPNRAVPQLVSWALVR
jgi:hypothetical protein